MPGAIGLGQDDAGLGMTSVSDGKVTLESPFAEVSVQPGDDEHMVDVCANGLGAGLASRRTPNEQRPPRQDGLDDVGTFGARGG